MKLQSKEKCAKIYAYLGEASETPAEQYSIRLEHIVRSFCDEKGYEIAGLYKEKEALSSSSLKPGLIQLLYDLLLQGGTKVVVPQLSVFSENPIEREGLLLFLESKEVEVHSCAEKDSQPADDSRVSEIRISMQKEFSCFDRGFEHAKRYQGRQRTRLKKGKCEGRKSYEEAAPEILRNIQEMRQKRGGLKQRTWQEIARQLNMDGLTTLTGRPFTGNNVATISHRRQTKTCVTPRKARGMR